ncbi:MAG: heavy metal translocating P-type ATPase [Pyrinomonadaceae bacterium]
MAEDTPIQNCELCGIDVGRNPFAMDVRGEEKHFCCMGCMNVYTILLESGAVDEGVDFRETEIFKRSEALGLISNGAGIKKKSVVPEGAETKETVIHVSGMWCPACSWLIEHDLSGVPGVVSAEAFFASDIVKVEYCPQFVPPQKLRENIEKLGYKTSDQSEDSNAADEERRSLVIKIGLAAFLWVNIMTLSVPLYVGYFQEISESVRSLFPLLLMVLSIPVVFYSASPILRIAWQGLKSGSIRMETLLSTGILTAFFYSSFQAFRGETHVYFDTAAALVTLVLLGKLMERGAKDRTTRAVSNLYRMMPKKVRIMHGSVERFIPLDDLNVGDEFIVKAGERIPADGTVLVGATHTDESLLSGESAPVARIEGSGVVSGSLNITSAIRVSATRVGSDATLAQIISLVENALSSRSSIERTVDAVSRVFVPAVIVISVLTLFGSYWLGATSIEDSVMRAVAVLVIACPCALGLATPLALTAAVGAASKSGILIGDSSVLEKLRSLDAIVFDKTGTVTAGDFEVVDLFADDETEADAFADSMIPALAAVEKYSEHPLGQAVVRFAERRKLRVPEAGSIEVISGKGIRGVVSGVEYFAGNQKLVDEYGCDLSADLVSKSEIWQKAGRTVAYVGTGREVKGILAFGDSVRPEATEAFADLRAQGIETIIVSGDANATTAYVADEVGADGFLAEAVPADKIAFIEERQKDGSMVAMIGDGINDAPALAKSDLGIAMGSGTEIAMKAADMVLMGGDLSKITYVIDLAYKTRNIVRQNLFWAFFYNTLGISLAAFGILNPIMAAAAMFVSSLSVIGNSFRLSRSLMKQQRNAG